MKTKRRWTLIGGICLSLVLAALLLPACAPAAPEEVAEEIADLEAEIADLEDDVAAEKAKVSDLGKEIAALKKPAEVFKWKFQTWATPGSMAFKSYAYTLDQIRAASGGRIDGELFGVGVLVGAVEALEAEGEGIIDGSFGFGGYYGGYDAAFSIMGHGATLWPDRSALALWYEQFGGKELFRELYGEYNVYYIGAMTIGSEAINSKVPIRSIEDFKGLKIRMGGGGFGAEVFTRLGATIVFIPGGEIYSALDTGLVDAAEYLGPGVNWDLGFHEVTDYFLYPSPHGTTISTDWTLNMDVWKGLPDDLKAFLEVAAYAAGENFFSMTTAYDYEAVEWMIDYGLEQISFGPEEYDKVTAMAIEVALEFKEKSPMSDTIITSQFDYWRYIGHIE